MLTLKGRTMIITGGAGNNGLAIIRMALAGGMNVAFMSGWHSKAQKAIAKLDPKYKDQVIGFAQNPQAQLAMNMADAPELYNENSTQEDVLHWIVDRFGGWYFNPSFSAARGGMISLTQEMAKEMGPLGITVNCVLTGHIEEDVPDEDHLPDDMRAELLARTPLGRLGKPEDIAAAVNFFASEESSFITGAVLDVNGGALMG